MSAWCLDSLANQKHRWLLNRRNITQSTIGIAEVSEPTPLAKILFNTSYVISHEFTVSMVQALALDKTGDFKRTPR